MICRDFQIYHYLKCIKYQLHLVEMTYPSWPLRSHIGRKISQTPNFSRQNMGCARLSQKLKSPTKLTECALGAHTAKRVPHSPPRTGMSFSDGFFRGIRMDQVLVARQVLACEYEAPCGGRQTLRSKAPQNEKKSAAMICSLRKA